MKTCQYCNHKCEDSVSICPSCGANQFYSEIELQKRQDQMRAEEEKWKRAEEAQKQRVHKLLGTVFAIAVVVVAAITIISYVKTSMPYRDAGISRTEAKEYLEAGVDYFSNGNYEEAIACFVKIPNGTAEYEEAQKRLENSIDNYRDYVLNMANGYESRDDYIKELDLLDTALTFLQDDDQIKVAREQAYQSFQSYMVQKVNEYKQNGEYEVGLSVLTDYINRFPSLYYLQDLHDDLESQYFNVIRATATDEASAMANDYDFAGAIRILDTAIERVTPEYSAEMVALKNSYEQLYADAAISAAKEAYIEYNAESIATAESIINEALALLPYNQSLNDELQFYHDKEPVSVFLYPSTVFSSLADGGRFEELGTALDNRGNTYSNAYRVAEFGDYKIIRGSYQWYAYKLLELDFQYSKITGVVFQNSNYSNATVETEFDIFGFGNENPEYCPYIVEHGQDKVALFHASVSSDNSPVSIAIDVSGRRYVELMMIADSWNAHEDEPYNYVYIAQLYLWR